jgi:O-antigen/teichoic acid export membrane protein
MPSSNVQEKMARGAGWMLLLTFVDRSVGLVSTLILARLLVPADFGIVAMAWSFIFVAELLAAFGFDIALIHKQDATRRHFDTAWTMNVSLGAVILILMLIAARPVSSFYDQPAVFWVVCVLAWSPLIAGFENIGVVAFRKDLDFRKEFAYQIIRRLVGFAVTVPLAFLLRNYWALVIGTLGSRLAGTIASYLVHPYRPRFSLAELASLFRFSKWLLLNNVVGFLKERSSDFVIGRLNGPAALGLYNVNYEIASMPTTALSAPINRALLPGFARIASDHGAMGAAYRNAIGILSLIALPAAAGIFAVAPYLVPVALGQKWLAGVPLMEILAFNGGLLLIHSSICTALIAVGRPDRVVKTNAAYVVMLLGLFLLLVPRLGLPGAAYAALMTSILSTPIYLWQVRRTVGVFPSEFLRAVMRPIGAAIVMALVVRSVLPEWTEQMASLKALAWLLAGIVIGIMTYFCAILLLWLAAGRPDGAERVVLAQIWQRLQKGGANGQPART